MGRVTVSFTISDKSFEWLKPFKSRSKFIDTVLSELFKNITHEELMRIIASCDYQEDKIAIELINKIKYVSKDVGENSVSSNSKTKIDDKKVQNKEITVDKDSWW